MVMFDVSLPISTITIDFSFFAYFIYFLLVYHRMLTIMDKFDISLSISTILDGSNSISWVQEMSNSSKGCKLQQFVNRDICLPIQKLDEDEEEFSNRLEDQDNTSHQITAWFENTLIPSIYLQFGGFGIAKEVWDFLA